MARKGRKRRLIRDFNKKRYFLQCGATNAHQRDAVKKRLKNKGNNVRVIKSTAKGAHIKYYLYSRKKSKRKR